MLLLALGACATLDVSPTATNARDWLNQYRAGHGLSAIALDSRLTAFAQAQAKAMAASEAMDHDVAGSFKTRVDAAGFTFARTAENLATVAPNEKAVMEQWKGSPAHDANLRLPRATRFGIGSARSNGPAHRLYWAMVIATDPPAAPVLAMPTGPDQGPGLVAVPSGELAAGAAPPAPPFAGLFGR